MSEDDKKNLPVKKTGTALTTGKKSAILEKVRSGKVAKAPVSSATSRRSDLVAAAIAGVPRPRLVFGFDATASREPAWETSRKITDSMFSAVPGQLDVALAVHGGSQLHTFTSFSNDAKVFRDKAAQVKCLAGGTQLVPLLDRALEHAGVKVVLYIGDVYEESGSEAMRVAEACRLRGIRVILFHDGAEVVCPPAFHTLADTSGGAVFPFDANAPDRLRDLLSAVALLAAGGIKLLESKRSSHKGAALLLEHIKQ